ncbi:probable LRR receptor-like serine/threonine-protein kinase At1g12460 [Macadamia integrifolia]|uniref:probable LRR receptor-like serine/threonine-protein kinase At1g12460 n=1 Tax=Macadamia integrifolia TaxID=60698 RepID=UPI001C533B0B|nr:probable LRR receptor-like serine/threonine-protein kinase At1g12460 [Macadamia integrifolia]
MRRIRRFFYRFLLLFVTALLRSTVYPLTEKEILLEFKGNITDDPFNTLNSWQPDRDPCTDYRGVFCNPQGFVERIVLWNTSLAGVLSPSLSGLKLLRTLSLYGNRFTGSLPSEFAEIVTLWKLNLSTNVLYGRIPEYLGDLRSLRLLDLSSNGLTGVIPEALFKNCFKTRFISFAHNSLSGSIPLSIAKCSKLVGFDFSFNNLSGSFPAQICDPPSMSYVSLRNNSLEGNIPKQISECQSLKFLDLGSNFFTGLVPFNLLGLKNLSHFNLSSNQFQGDIPAIQTCSDRMETFDVSRNDLSGEIPPSLKNCRSLRSLDASFNQLNGSIPLELGSIEYLQVLDLHNLRLTGEIPNEISNCRFLLELVLSGNGLQGGIPSTLYNMTYLKTLDLHQNHLNGSISPNLGKLSWIQLLDLSENSLSGPIPESLGNLALLTYFNVSFNNLTGEIPAIPTLLKFGAAAFSHNPGLCGAPLNTLCEGNHTTSTSGKAKVLSVSAIVAIVAAAVIFTGVCVISFMNIRARRKRENEVLVVESTPPASTDSNVIIGKLVLFSKSLPSRYEDWEAGTKALLDKDCLIGGGSIGTVYKSSFEGGVSIAVKKLETLGRIRNQDEFEQEVGRLGTLQHPNLVAFQGYYWSSTMQLILSEFVSNGNLYDHLHGVSLPGTSTSGGRSELYWSRRFQIALGIARALAYLHHDCKPQVLHLNIKSTNILLDERYEAKLSDYGLIKLLPMLGSHGLTKFHTAVGYVAPELASQSLRFSDKCDVYSFGIILLELVTGKKPVESPVATEVVVLCEYVRGLLENGAASDCFDRTLRGFAENELIQVMKLGLICTSEVPSRRPNMAEVVQVLESIRSGSESQ